MKPRSASSRTALAASSILLTWFATAASAATLTWDTENGDGVTVTQGSGNWNLTAGNTVWNDGATPNVIWSQTSITDASNAAVFSGLDGSLNQYVVTIGAGTTVAAESITFNSSGYQITGGTLSLRPATTGVNGPITVAAGKTATINSAIFYLNNSAASNTIDGTLNLGGGAINSQYNFNGGGTVNITGGSYEANVGNINVGNFNITGGAYNITPGVSNGYNFGNAQGKNVNVTVSNTGSLTLNNTSTNNVATAPFIAVGNNTNNTAYTTSLTVQSGGTVIIATQGTRAGEIRISNTGNTNGLFDVQGGTVNVGAGNTANKIYLFKSGSNSGYSATMTQSGGTVTANGIQFGGSTGTYDAASSTTLQLSGGSLYVGAQGITRGAGASTLPATIKLQGGTLGASGTWSSSMDMKLGTATVRAANSGGAAHNITLSGVLSDDDGTGSLTKTGAGTLTLSGASDNTFTGATLVSAGTLDLGKVNAVSSSSSLTIANGAGLALTGSSSSVPNLTFEGAGSLSFNLADGYSLTVDDTDGVTNSGGAGSIAINVTGSAPANGTYPLIDYTGSLQGSGFSAYTLGSVPAGKSYSLNDSGSAVQLVVSSSYSWTGEQSSEWSTGIIAGAKNWALDGGPADYADGFAVFFDDTATNKTVEITGADVMPQSVEFSSGEYTLQGSHKIGGPAPITVAAAATLKLGSSDVLPDGAGTGNITVHGILDLNGNSETINALSGTGLIDNTAATTTSTLAVGAIAGGNFGGNLVNSVGTLALTKTGGTDFILSGNNSYSGPTNINQNRLFINNSTAFSPNTEVTVNSGASFILNASGNPAFSQIINLASGSNLVLRQAAALSNVALPASGSVTFNFDDVTTQAISLASNVTLGGSLGVQVGGGAGNPGSVTLAGIFSGTGSLVKNGSGLLSLAGANTFDGGVTIRSGTLEARTTNSALGTGTLTLGGSGSTGATFITGRAIANPITVNAPDSGSIVIGANGNGSGYALSGGITLNGDLTIQTFNNPVNPAVVATGGITGGITGTGNLVLNNNGLSANVFNITTAAINHNGSLTLQGSATGNTNIGAVIGSNVTAITQNSATSTMILSGANTYACNLTINAGTVRLSNNTNIANDSSIVTIAETGATLDLTYTGTDTVDKLVIGSTEQASGVYGKVGSASPIIGIPQITGDGTLTVGSPGVDFATWITGTFANGQVAAGKQGPNDDPDGDGISNLLEFAIEGQDPTVPNATIGSFDGSSLSFNKRQTPVVTGISYAIEESTDLGIDDVWDEVSGGSYVNNSTIVSYSFTPGTPPSNFLRLKVTQ